MTSFARKKIINEFEYLHCARKAQIYVASFLEKCEEGIYSREVEDAGRNNLYKGLAGILHMYLQFYLVEQNEKAKGSTQKLIENHEAEASYRKVSFINTEYVIREMTRYLSLHWKDGLEYVKQNGEAVLGMAEAFYSGIGGIGLVLNEVYRFLKDKNAKTAAWEIVSYYKEHAVRTPKGIYWSDNSVIYFDGGITLFLIDSFLTYPGRGEEVYSLITDSCDYILSNAIRHDHGGLEFDYLQVDFKHKEPNFEFGTAGIGYLFVKAYEITNDERYVQAAKSVIVYMKNIAVKQKKGYLIPYKLGVHDNLFYLGNCHGPVGTAKLFYELYKVTNEEQYLQEVYALIEGARSLGAPFVQSAGFWNTICLCCGPAGYASVFTGLYNLTGEKKWKHLANGVGEILVGSKLEYEKSGNKGIFWEIAFDRTSPGVLTSPAGYFTGAAGIAVALLQIYCMCTENKGGLHLIDDPYEG